MPVQPVRYEIYMPNSQKVWLKYKTDSAFYKKLSDLADLRTLKTIHVYVPRSDSWYVVTFNPTPDCKWKSENIFGTKERP